MASLKSHRPLAAGTATVRRKPALTYQSPAQSTAIPRLEKPVFISSSGTSPVPKAPPTRLSQVPELSQRTAVTYKLSRHHMTPTLLPLYHPFGTLALSLPDLDPTALGLPALVAVFDDPTRRCSNRVRRPAAKVRDADDPATSHPPLFVEATPTPECEPREKPSPRRRRGGGGSGPGGNKRKRKELEDGDATYPAKRFRNPRSSGVALGLSGTHAAREEVSPVASNAHSGASPAVEAGQGDPAEEKKRERRTTRARGVIVRRDSTASAATATSASPSVCATHTAASRVAPRGEPIAEPASNDAPNEASAPEGRSKKANSNDVPVSEQREIS